LTVKQGKLYEKNPTMLVEFQTGLEGKMDLLTVVCLFSMEWDCGAARERATRGSNNNIIFVGREIIVLLISGVQCVSDRVGGSLLTEKWRALAQDRI